MLRSYLLSSHAEGLIRWSGTGLSAFVRARGAGVPTRVRRIEGLGLPAIITEL